MPITLDQYRLLLQINTLSKFIIGSGIGVAILNNKVYTDEFHNPPSYPNINNIRKTPRGGGISQTSIPNLRTLLHKCRATVIWKNEYQFVFFTGREPWSRVYMCIKINTIQLYISSYCMNRCININILLSVAYVIRGRRMSTTLCQTAAGPPNEAHLGHSTLRRYNGGHVIRPHQITPNAAMHHYSPTSKLEMIMCIKKSPRWY